ncbi:MAG TPA: hypothetical protein VFE51_29765 [Verrucomicrobiae bacterium]|nr:hypothetical protein [Verrucomicrobiae bacterium]
MNLKTQLWITVIACRCAGALGQAFTFTTVAGNAGYGSNDGSGDYVQFHEPGAVAFGSSGELFIADSYNHTIRRVSSDGVVSTFAGLAWVSGTNDGVGALARFNLPFGLAADETGNVFVADFGNQTIRMLSSNGMVCTIAGLPGVAGFADGTNQEARFNGPISVAVDQVGNLYVADYWNNLIREIARDGTNWIVTTIAGSVSSYGSDDGTNGSAHFYWPHGVAVDVAGNIYVADTFNSTIRRAVHLGTNWIVTTLAGTPRVIGVSDGTNSAARFDFPRGLTVSTNGTIFVADSDASTVRSISQVGNDWVVGTVAGDHSNGSRDGTNLNTQFNEPSGITVSKAGTLFVADTDNNLIRTITNLGTNWVVRTFVGSTNGPMPDGVGPLARFSKPSGVTVDVLGNVYVADTYDCAIRKIDPTEAVSTLAGFGGCALVDGTNTDAQFNYPWGIAVDRNGTLFIADSYNNRVRQILRSGSKWVTTIVTDPINQQIPIATPEAIAVGNRGELYVANTMIWKLTPVGSNWDITNVAGQAGSTGSTDGTNSNARFSVVFGIAVDSSGTLFVADTLNHTIRSIVSIGLDWIVTTIAGLAGNSGSSDGTNSDARFNLPAGIVVGSTGELYVADSGNNTIRRLKRQGTDWIVDTIGGVAGNTGNADGTGAMARFNFPFGLAIDTTGGLYVADSFNGTIRYGWTSPMLRAGRKDSEIVLKWPLVARAYALETASTLSSSANWNAITNGIVVNGNNLVVTNRFSQQVGVYRLRQGN